MTKTLFSLRTISAMVAALVWLMVAPIMTNATRPLPSGDYHQALTFAQDYFASTDDFAIEPDPDGGYFIRIYDDEYDLDAFQSALDEYLLSQYLTSIDDGVPGIPTYHQALTFAQDYFASTDDFAVLPDPDGGYVVVYYTTSYDPTAVQAALDAYLLSETTVSLDLGMKVEGVSDPLTKDRPYIQNLEVLSIRNFAEYKPFMTGPMSVPVLMEYDFGRDGMGGAGDFAETVNLIVDLDGVGRATMPVAFAETGNWRYRATIDPTSIYETDASTRDNNVSDWENFIVVAPTTPTPTTPDASGWKLISDFGSWGAGYANKSTGGMTCEAFTGWVCDVRPGQPVPQVEVLVDGVLFDTFYPHIRRSDLVSPWWAGLSTYGNMPGCGPIENDPYGFRWNTPASLKDGVERTVTLRATRSDGHSNFIVNAGWLPVHKSFPLQCAPETGIVDLDPTVTALADQQQDVPFTVSGITVTNHGDLPTGDSFTARLFFDRGDDGYGNSDDDFFVDTVVGALDPGETTTVDFPAVTQSVTGLWSFAVLVDPGRLVEPDVYGQRKNNWSEWLSYNVNAAGSIGSDGSASVSLFGSPETITLGDSSQLTWVALNALPTANITGVGDVNTADGSVGVSVSPTVDTTYTMTVEDATGGTATDQVTISVVDPASIDLTVRVNGGPAFTAPAAVPVGSPADVVEVTWDGVNVASCVKNFVNGTSVSGSEVFDPIALEPGGSRTLTVSCETLAGGTVQESITLGVEDFTVSLSSTESLVSAGATDVPFTYTVSLPGSATYALECTFGGAVSDSFTLSGSNTDTVLSGPLANTVRTVLSCTEPTTGYTVESNEVVTEVAPSVQEI